MILSLALKNIVSRKSSVVIILFISFAIALLVLTNSIFDSTENGIKETFVSSFTGDIVIRPKSENPLSLLGDETPITGSFTEIPPVSPYEEIYGFLKTVPQIKLISPQISGMAALDFNGQKFPAIVFGTETENYLRIMDSIKLLEGRAFSDDEDGIMLSTQIANKIGAGLGSDIQFVVAEGLTARIRSAPLTAIYSYPVEHSIFDELVIMNPETARELLGMNSLYSSEDIVLDEDTENLLSDYDLDSLFEEADDFNAAELAQKYSQNTEVAKEAELPESEASVDFAKEALPDFDIKNASDTTWNFIICDAENSKDVPKIIRTLNKKFKKSGWPVEAVNWRNAAGSTAMYLYFLRMILNVGIIVVLIAGFIVINNTLVVNILDRIQEIGTMRAIGTSKLFVSLQCMAETLILALAAGLLGLVLGSFLSRLVLASHITFTNTFLIQLFGGNQLVTVVKVASLIKCFMVSLVLGMVAWIYPVHTALSTSPVTAMTGAR